MICMTLLVRNEEDIIKENIEYHLNRGVDFIIATDNLSTDATTEILKEYERLGYLHYILEQSDDYSQDLWVTRMAKLAKHQFSADWIIHTDADEFWWPLNEKSLKEILESTPQIIDGLIVNRSNFTTPANFDSNKPFYDQMLYRQVKSTNPTGKPLPPKVCHRAFDDVYIHQGNHDFELKHKSRNSRVTEDLVIWHFQYRGYENYMNKIKLGGAAYARNTRFKKKIGKTWRDLYQLLIAGKLEAHYHQNTINDIESQLSKGILISDQRFQQYMNELLGKS